MLSDFPISARLPASDIGRARAWYEQKLGLQPESEEMGGQALWYQTGGAWALLYQTEAAGSAQNTSAGWTVTGIEAVMDEMRQRGVIFEEYDFGEMKTENGLLNIPPGYKSAWFKDSEGNILELSEVPLSG
ncbi:MAG: VOC family protein [Acidimicrobiia bacterium]